MRSQLILCVTGLAILVVAATPAGTAHSSADKPGQASIPQDPTFMPDAVALGDDETVYLLDSDESKIYRWLVSTRSYSETIQLDGAADQMAHSPTTNRLYLAYAPRTISQVKLDTSLDEIAFTTTPLDIRTLATAGRYPFISAPDPDGVSWDHHLTFDPADGSVISDEYPRYKSSQFAWSDVKRALYFISDYNSPKDLIKEQVDASGLIKEEDDSPQHSSTGMEQPVRVAPDGSTVVLGSGRLHNADTLAHVGTLSNPIDDATWSDGTLFTIREQGSGTQVQKWAANYTVNGTYEAPGTPIRVFPVSEGVLIITHFLDRPWFTILDNDLSVIYEEPFYRIFTPLICRNS